MPGTPFTRISRTGRRETDDTELVRPFIRKLRRRPGDDAASPSYIQTERGVGYRMLG